MSRLTFRDSKGELWIKDAADIDEQGQICMLTDRLAAYEDIGLEPSEIENIIHNFESFLCEMTGNQMSKPNYTLEAMVSVANDYQQSICDECGDRQELAQYEQLGTVEELSELVKAKQDGRCVVLDAPRKPLVWGDEEQNSCLCPECGRDLMGIPYGHQMVLQCPECGEYLDATKCITREEAEEALKEAQHVNETTT